MFRVIHQSDLLGFDCVREKDGGQTVAFILVVVVFILFPVDTRRHFTVRR